MKAEPLSQEHQKAVDRFMNHVKIKYDKESTLTNYRQIVTRFIRQVNKPIHQITLEDVENFLGKVKPSSAESLKKPISSFFEFNNIKMDIPRNSKVLNVATKGEEAVLTPEQIEAIVECPERLKHKAIVEVLIITGGELKAIHGLDIRDVKIENDCVWIHIREGKESTGNRKNRNIPIIPNPNNPVARFPKYLVQWLEFRKSATLNDPLFTSTGNKRISKAGIYDKVVKIGTELGIHLSPHIFRHTGATYDGQYLPEQMLCTKYGWSIGSNMARRYCHTNEKQLKSVLLKEAGLKEDEAKKGRPCFRCNEINNINAELCVKCGQILDSKKLMEQVNKQEQERNKLKREIEMIKKYYIGNTTLLKLIVETFKLDQLPEFKKLADEVKKQVGL